MNSSRKFCIDGIWNNVLFQNTNYPIFTNCFQYSILLISPGVFLLMLLISTINRFSINEYQTETDNKRPINIIHATKIVLTLFCALFATIEMTAEILYHDFNDPMLIISYSGFFSSLIFLAIFVGLKRNENQSVYIISFVFWWMATGTYAITFYNHVCQFMQNIATRFQIFYFINSFLLMLALLISLILDSYPSFRQGSNPEDNPENTSPILSQITYSWMDRYIYRWFKKEMTNETVYNLNPEDESFINSKILEKYFFKKSRKKIKLPRKSMSSNENLLVNDLENKPSRKYSGMTLLSSLYLIYFKLIAIGWTFKIFRDLLILTLPLIMKYLLDYFRKNDENSYWKGIFYAFVFFFQGLLGSIFENYCFTITSKISIRVRGALIGTIYKKTLRLSSEARSIHSAGDIVNMTSVDMEQIVNWISYSWIIISCPFQITVAIILLYLELGFSILIGLAVIVALIPLNILIMKLTNRFSEEELIWKDKRMNILTEILSGIKIIKMYTWEKCFNSKITAIRTKEIKQIRNFSTGWCVLSVMWDVVPFLVMFLTFTFYIYVVPSHVINAEKIFVSLVLFNNLQLPILLLPWILSQTITAIVSFGRIETLLMANEKDLNATRPLDDNKIDPDTAVAINNGWFSWSAGGKSILNNINMSVKNGSLVAIVGPVGVGKSSLLSTILGEMNHICGTVQTQGTLALVPQEAWIQNKTIKNNILFTKEYNDVFYKEVIKACCLDYDINTFPMGDETEIGERGINLSGGQKQRISLARAIYQNQDIYLMDDPLSAVDANIGQQLFNNILSDQGLLKTKTRILVTHGMKWLQFVDEIIVLDLNGQISEKGTYQALMDSGKEFQRFMIENSQSSEEHMLNIPTTSKVDEQQLISPSQKFERKRQRTDSEKCGVTFIETTTKNIENEEEVMNGRVSCKAFFWYFKSRGFGVFALSTLACIVFGGLQAFGNVWLGKLSDAESSNSSVNSSSSNNDYVKYYINSYGIIGLLQCITVIFFWGGFTYGSLKASKKIHKIIFNCLLRGTLSFFDATPSGRIMNRFTKDLYLIDHILNLNITDIINRFVLLLTSFVVITVVTPWFGVTGIPVIVVYCVLQIFYISSSRQSRRLDSKASSFVFTHVNETYKGTSVIRSFRSENEFQDIQYLNIDNSNKFKLIQFFSLRWLCLRLDILGNLVVFGAVIFSVMNRSTLNPSLVGLSISYALQITSLLNWLMRQISEFETNAVSIERLREYSLIPSEAKWETNGALSKTWVTHGNISFQNFSLQYHIRKPLILKNISLNILGGEKIGIVGRTGAGKSTLTLALFRLMEGYSGKILIDGVDISSIGLHELRSQLTILPQDPVIFSGSLKENLDPFNEHNDEKLIKCLEISGLKNWLNSLDNGLHYDCGSMGTNLSTGQKQLLCLARTILKKSKIIILDEATASVDEETDRKVMEAVRSQFAQSTVIIIAHRISTIINCDRIMCLDNGTVVEFGSPEELLSNPSGYFRSLAMQESEVKKDK